MRNIYLLSIAFVMGLSACKNEEHQGGTPAEYYDIPDSKISEYEKNGTNGDGKAAWGLAHYYSFTKIDKGKSLYWYKVSAENGYAPGMYAYGVTLSQSSDKLADLKIAIYWLREAANRGQPHSAFVLDQLEKKYPNL